MYRCALSRKTTCQAFCLSRTVELAILPLYYDFAIEPTACLLFVIFGHKLLYQLECRYTIQ
jgi:hypothetical protein